LVEYLQYKLSSSTTSSYLLLLSTTTTTTAPPPPSYYYPYLLNAEKVVTVLIRDEVDGQTQVSITT